MKRQLSEEELAEKRRKRKAYEAAHYAKNREAIIARTRAYNIENAEKALENKRKWKEKNKDKIKEQDLAWNKENKERKEAKQDAYRKANPDKVAAWAEVSAERKKEKLKQLSPEEKKARSDRQRAHDAKRKPGVTERARLNYHKNIELHRQTAKNYRERRPEVAIRAAAVRKTRIESDTTEEERKAADRVVVNIRRRKHVKCSYCSCDLPIGERQIDHIIPLAKGGRHLAENLCVSCKSCNCSKNDSILYVDWFPKNYKEKFLLTLADFQVFLGVTERAPIP